MAAKRDDGPSLILRIDRGRIIPAAAIDEETLAGFRPGTELQASIIKVAPSKALRAWWALLGAVVKADVGWTVPRALSNAMLLKMECVERELLIGGGERKDPMSLKDFSDEQLWKLVEWAKLIIVTEIIPGVDLAALTGHDG